ncbi:MAG: DUF177 domain-containing protein [Sphingomonadaceae bacterium]
MSPEFPHPLPLAQVPAAGLALRLSPDAGQLAALAGRLGLLGLHAFRATLTLMPASGGHIAVAGRMEAEVEQRCGVSLDPFRQRIARDFAWRLLPEGVAPSDGEEDPDDIECPGGIADLGEALVQELSLALDPHPRRPGAELPAQATAEEAGPFAALAKLRHPR